MDFINDICSALTSILSSEKYNDLLDKLVDKTYAEISNNYDFSYIMNGIESDLFNSKA